MQTQNQPKQTNIFKIILVGGQGVGKTSLMQRYVDGTFKQQYFSTIGIDFKLHNISVGEHNIKLQIWDTAGQEKFQSLTSQHFKGAHACICVLDITRPESIDSARFYLDQALKQYALEPECVFLVANKLDMEQKRSVPHERVQELGSEYGVRVVGVSAKEGTNVNKLFEDMSVKLITNQGGVAGVDHSGTSLTGDNPRIQFRENNRRCSC